MNFLLLPLLVSALNCDGNIAWKRNPNYCVCSQEAKRQFKMCEQRTKPATGQRTVCGKVWQQRERECQKLIGSRR